jgi:hypothetical protein
MAEVFMAKPPVDRTRTGDAGETADRLPRRRRGGQELPDNVQDRPEQNEGYDVAVRSGGPGESVDDMFVDADPGSRDNDEIRLISPGEGEREGSDR